MSRSIRHRRRDRDGYRCVSWPDGRHERRLVRSVGVLHDEDRDGVLSLSDDGIQNGEWKYVYCPSGYRVTGGGYDGGAARPDCAWLDGVPGRFRR